jgi:hypothetical protein
MLHAVRNACDLTTLRLNVGAALAEFPIKQRTVEVWLCFVKI